MKKWLIITDYWEWTWIWNYAIDLYLSLKDNINIDFLNLHNKKWFSNIPNMWDRISIWNYFSWIFLWISWKKLLNYLKENKYEYVVLWHQWMWYLIPYIKKANIKVITILHDLMSYNIYKNNLFHIIFRNISTNKIINSDKIIFISENTRADFCKLWFKFNWETKVISNFIDDKKYYKLEQKNHIYKKFNIIKENYDRIFISVTNWQPHKNDITFIKLAKEYQESLFIKIWYISWECQNYIKNNNLNNILNFLSLSSSELCELYNISDIYINTSKKEGFWYPPFEALFCWIKLVTTNSINIENQKWIYVVNDFYNIDEYKKWISKVVWENIDFSNIKFYKIDRFKNEFIELLK